MTKEAMMMQENSKKAVSKFLSNIELMTHQLRVFSELMDAETELVNSRDVADYLDIEHDELLDNIHYAAAGYWDCADEITEARTFFDYKEDEEGEYCMMNLYGFNIATTEDESTLDIDLECRKCVSLAKSCYPLSRRNDDDKCDAPIPVLKPFVAQPRF